MPDLLTLWAVAVFALGGLMYLAMSRNSAHHATSFQRPGWLARRRAARGVAHPAGGAAIGYRSVFGRVSLSAREFALGGLALGAPGSGKTTLAALLVQAIERNRCAGVILDPKPSRALTEAVASADGIVWTLGGALAWDALPDDPTELANQLLEVEPVDGQMRVYRNAARLQALSIGRVLQRRGEHPTLKRVAELMRPGALPPADMPKLSASEAEGVRSFGTSLQILAGGAAGRSLWDGQSRDCLRLEDAITDSRIVLFQLDASRYPEETRQLGAWILRAMLRLLRRPERCWLIADEFARLGWQGRHAVELLALGREFSKPVVLLSQGPSDLRELGPHALDQVAQDAAWIIAFRQGTRDSETASRLLGVRPTEERTWSNNGYEHMRLVEKPIVPAHVLEDLPPGTAYLRVPPIERARTRVEPVRVAMPDKVSVVLPAPGGTMGDSREGDMGSEAGQVVDCPPCPDPRIVAYTERQGVHWVWQRPTMVNSTGYPRLKIDGKYESVHRWWWERLNGPVPEGMTLHHTCDELYGKMCVWPGCMQVVTRERNTELRWARDREA